MPFQVITTTLASALATSGTLAFTYPAGTTKGDFTTYEGFLVTANNDVFSTSAKDFTISLGDTTATITWRSTTTLPVGTTVSLQLNEKGIQPYEAKKNKELLDWQVLRKTRELKPLRVNLGNPSTADDDGILTSQSVGATATSLTLTASNVAATYSFTNGIDVPRNVTVKGSSGSDQVITVTGRDAYGNTLKETLTLSGTTNITGNKAFKYVDSYSVAAGGSASKTFTMGWGNKLGIPFFVKQWNQITGQYVDAELIATNSKVRLPFFINATDLSAGTSQYIASPVYGFIGKADTIVQVAIVTGGDITFNIASVAVVGLTCTSANSATVGTVVSDTSTSEFGSTGEIGKDAAIEVAVAAAFNGGGALNGFIEITPGGAFAAGDETVATATTNDVRGMWTPPTALTCNGSRVYELDIIVYDPQYLGLNQYTG